MALVYKAIRTVGTQVAAASASQLWTVNVNTGAGAAVLKIYDGQSAGGTLIGSIDASTKSSQLFGVTCPGGIFLDLSGGNADCTVGIT